jgi:hypothetical protein
MSRYLYNGRIKEKRSSFKDFKKEFFKNQWKRNPLFRHAFFSLDDMCSEGNYIHAGVVVINNIKYVFDPISFWRFTFFISKNRTTDKNKFQIVNNNTEIRKNKLKKLKRLSK